MPVVSEIWTMGEGKANGKWPDKLRTEPVKPGDTFYEVIEGKNPDGKYLQTIKVEVLEEGVRSIVTHSSERFRPNVLDNTYHGKEMNGWGISVEGPNTGLLGRTKTRRVFKFK